ncbi:MAG: hypothetical protein MJZ34_02650 [Paludibacteraceae bacterium]|nr:hypothetical protein [Paludibacteraceae bacterium]
MSKDNLSLQEIIKLQKYAIDLINKTQRYEIYCANCQYVNRSMRNDPCIDCSGYSNFTPTSEWKSQHPDIEVSE